MKRIVRVAGLVVGFALADSAVYSQQVREDLAIVYEPATGGMRLEYSGTGSIDVQAFDLLSRGNGSVGTATVTTQGVLTGATAALPTAAFRVFNNQASGVNGLYSQVYAANFTERGLTLSNISPGVSNVCNFGTVAPAGWNQTFVNASFVTDPDSAPNFSTNQGLGYFMFSEMTGGFQLARVLAAGPGEIVINVASGSKTQAEAGYPTITEAGSVTKTGAGTLVFNAANAYTGPTLVSAGTLRVTNNNGLAATAVTVETGGTLALVQDARVTVGVGSLAVMETSGGGKLDVGAGQVSIGAGGITAAALRADLIAGRNGGAWNGASGITSSTAATSTPGTRAVGYVINADDTTRVSFAAMGDIDLNGSVDVFDLVGINSSGTYGTGQASAWYKGDVNYDGVTSVFDLVAINSGGAYGKGNYFPAAPAVLGGITAVPEPSRC